MSSLPLAIEINENITRIADAQYQNEVVLLQSLGSSDTIPSYFSGCWTEIVQQRQAQVIQHLAAELKVADRLVNVVIPDSVAYAQIIETPILAEKDLITAIRYQADEFIPMNVDDTYLDLEILQEDTTTNKLSILIVAAPKKMVDGVYKTIQLAGFEPNRLETEISAVGRLVSEIMRVRDVKEGYCIFNLGYSGSSIYMVNSLTNTLVFHRSCRVGFELIQKEIMTNLNIEKAQALQMLLDPKERRGEMVHVVMASMKDLASEINRIVDVYTRRYNLPVSRIYTINFTSYMPDFGRILTELTHYQIQPLPLNTVYVPNPVLKVFSSEITGFAAAVSSILI